MVTAGAPTTRSLKRPARPARRRHVGELHRRDCAVARVPAASAAARPGGPWGPGPGCLPEFERPPTLSCRPGLARSLLTSLRRDNILSHRPLSCGAKGALRAGARRRRRGAGERIQRGCCRPGIEPPPLGARMARGTPPKMRTIAWPTCLCKAQVLCLLRKTMGRARGPGMQKYS